MSQHFDYLLDDASRTFFQKVAEERAAVPGRRDRAGSAAAARPTEKTASARSAIEKLAGEIETDLYILRSAGPIGCNLGMTKRALAHLGRLADDPRIVAHPGVVPDLFDKVAAAAVDADLEAATAQLCALAPAGDQGRVRAELAKIARELVVGMVAAQQEITKVAAGLGLAGLGRAGRIAETLRGAESAARGVAGAAEGGLARLGRQWRARSALNARSQVSQIGKEIEGTRAARQGIEASRGQMKPQQFAQEVGANKAVAAGQQQQYARAQAAYAGRRGAAVAKSPAAGAVQAPTAAAPRSAGAPTPTPATPRPTPTPTAAPPPRTSAPAPSTASSARSEAERKFSKVTGGKFDAAKPAKGPQAPQPTPPKESGAEADAGARSPEGEENEGGSAMDALKKLHTSGWSSLKPHEKNKLITGGVGIVGAHRLLTGRDLISGDKND